MTNVELIVLPAADKPFTVTAVIDLVARRLNKSKEDAQKAIAPYQTVTAAHFVGHEIIIARMGDEITRIKQGPATYPIRHDRATRFMPQEVVAVTMPQQSGNKSGKNAHGPSPLYLKLKAERVAKLGAEGGAS
jgi:hypothetical protein